MFYLNKHNLHKIFLSISCKFSLKKKSCMHISQTHLYMYAVQLAPDTEMSMPVTFLFFSSFPFVYLGICSENIVSRLLDTL